MSKLTLVIISDTHGYHESVKLPDGDVLIHCGDFGHGGIESSQDFLNWFTWQRHSRKILIAGNHDRIMEKAPEKVHIPKTIDYLKDSGIDILGFKFWGSPYQPAFCDWAFNVERGKLHEHWDKIPEGTDVLITHGPPYCILDLAQDGEHCGCEELYAAIQRVPPLLHCFGHIHYSYGTTKIGKTTFINASTCGESYRPDHKPWVFQLEK